MKFDITTNELWKAEYYIEIINETYTIINIQRYYNENKKEFKYIIEVGRERTKEESDYIRCKRMNLF